MSLRKRNEHTHWMNDGPITDLYEALELLRPGWNDPLGKHTRYLSMTVIPPELHVQWYSHGDSGGDSSGIHYFEIAPKVVAELQKQGMLKPLSEKGWGYTHHNHNKLIVSDYGLRELDTYIEQARENARKMLVPGVHSQFSGIFNDAGSGRDSFRGSGKLYFDFVTPMNEKVRVFPGTQKIEILTK